MADRSVEWKKLRRQIQRERRTFENAEGKSKDAKVVYAALAGAYGGVLRMMDALEKS